MDLNESEVQSFIVKLWLDETAAGVSRRMSHGYVTHVPSGERRYVKELDGITDFIEDYMEGLGVEFGRRWRARHWVRRWKQRLTGQE